MLVTSTSFFLIRWRSRSSGPSKRSSWTRYVTAPPPGFHRRGRRGTQRGPLRPLAFSAVKSSSYLHRLAHLRHGLFRHAPGARIALGQHLVDDARSPRELGAALTDGRELGDDVLDHDLLALEAADAGRAAA